jgi:hypothetical protein
VNGAIGYSILATPAFRHISLTECFLCSKRDGREIKFIHRYPRFTVGNTDLEAENFSQMGDVPEITPA